MLTASTSGTLAPTQQWKRDFGAIYIDVNICDFDANNNSADVRIYFFNLNQEGRSYENLFVKKQKKKLV